MLTRTLFSCFILLISLKSVFAEKMGIGKQPNNSILDGAQNWSYHDFFAFIEGFLLKVVLPLVIVGTALYIAYKLFLAEGNEEENKKAWKALTYASIGVIAIMLSYAIIAIVQKINV